jgi:hypothetical protein
MLKQTLPMFPNQSDTYNMYLLCTEIINRFNNNNLLNNNKIKLRVNCILVTTIYNPNRQFQLLVYACRGRWEVRHHITDYVEKKNGGRVNME